MVKGAIPRASHRSAPLQRNNCVLSSRELIAAHLIDGGILKVLDDGPAVTEKLFP
jgi:hypothetical protein